MAVKRKSGSRLKGAGRKLDSLLFGIPENRAKFMRTGQKNPAARKRAAYRLGHEAARRNPAGDPGAALVAAERTIIFREAAIADLAGAREFFVAGYQDGSQENPKAKSAFDRCVASVAAKGGAYDPRAVCASAGRKKLGQAEMTRRAKAGKKNYRAKNARPKRPASSLRGAWKSFQRQFPIRKVSGGWTAGQQGEFFGDAGRETKGQAIADQRATFDALVKSGKIGQALKRNPRNPLDTAQSAYEGFHGEKSKRTIVVQEKRHYHTHVWALGPLVYLKVWLPSDRREPGLRNFVEIEFDYEGKNPVLVTANEKRNQMFFDGGDQSVDLKVFGVPPEPHETVVLGEVSDAYYFTTKKHLGDQGGTAVYKHKLGEEGGELPTLIYHTLEKRMSLAGGSYTIPNEGVRN
jgi:hypothetical protein